jgi:hypothetical protein
MTSWEGTGDPGREPVRVGLARTLAAILCPWLALDGEVTTDGPCVVETAPARAYHHALTDTRRANAALTGPEPEAQ